MIVYNEGEKEKREEKKKRHKEKQTMRPVIIMLQWGCSKRESYKKNHSHVKHPTPQFWILAL